VNDITRVSYGSIAVPEADSGFVFDVTTPVQYFEGVSRHAFNPKCSYAMGNYFQDR
jgi:hypothetical protein